MATPKFSAFISSPFLTAIAINFLEKVRQKLFARFMAFYCAIDDERQNGKTVKMSYQ